jgi:hypothetical protein
MPNRARPRRGLSKVIWIRFRLRSFIAPPVAYSSHWPRLSKIATSATIVSRQGTLERLWPTSAIKHSKTLNLQAGQVFLLFAEVCTLTHRVKRQRPNRSESQAATDSRQGELRPSFRYALTHVAPKCYRQQAPHSHLIARTTVEAYRSNNVIEFTCQTVRQTKWVLSGKRNVHSKFSS